MREGIFRFDQGRNCEHHIYNVFIDEILVRFCLPFSLNHTTLFSPKWSSLLCIRYIIFQFYNVYQCLKQWHIRLRHSVYCLKIWIVRINSIRTDGKIRRLKDKLPVALHPILTPHTSSDTNTIHIAWALFFFFSLACVCVFVYFPANFRTTFGMWCRCVFTIHTTMDSIVFDKTTYAMNSIENGMKIHDSKKAQKERERHRKRERERTSKKGKRKTRPNWR